MLKHSLFSFKSLKAMYYWMSSNETQSHCKMLRKQFWQLLLNTVINILYKKNEETVYTQSHCQRCVWMKYNVNQIIIMLFKRKQTFINVPNIQIESSLFIRRKYTEKEKKIIRGDTQPDILSVLMNFLLFSNWNCDSMENLISMY